MRLVTFEYRNQLHLGIVIGNAVLDIQTAISQLPAAMLDHSRISTNCTSMLSLLNAPDETWKSLTIVHTYYLEILDQQNDRLLQENILVPLDAIKLHAPLPVPGKVICIAGNYPSPGTTRKPEYPTVFLKPSSTITGPDMPIWISDLTSNVAYEVELAIVIGKSAHQVPVSEAMQYVAGYTLANDLGDRALESRTSQWTSGKMFDSFTPIGPWLVTKDEIQFPNSLNLSTEVNGRLLQKGNTSEMFFHIPELVSILSTLTTLVSGDLILTGSTKMMDGQPNPLYPLNPGDQVTIKIEGLGELTNQVRKER
jgi:2-keto-4-pentenoate hydratase/2-oxohepta-3-ene-1,7-dioic acid hydratase in catechol pathway